MDRPLFSYGPRDRLLMVLNARCGHWATITDLMFDAGFGPFKEDDRLTPLTSFYFHLEQLKSQFPILHEGRNVMLAEMPA